mmetsp:Transcript_11536/g.26632  ORF Transcript_11536/g.26632 Transcript_11536/m.26632 type:complete len:274 (-) Transcript_11536:456-1277(-)
MPRVDHRAALHVDACEALRRSWRAVFVAAIARAAHGGEDVASWASLPMRVHLGVVELRPTRKNRVADIARRRVDDDMVQVCHRHSFKVARQKLLPRAEQVAPRHRHPPNRRRRPARGEHVHLGRGALPRGRVVHGVDRDCQGEALHVGAVAVDQVHGAAAAGTDGAKVECGALRWPLETGDEGRDVDPGRGADEDGEVARERHVVRGEGHSRQSGTHRGRRRARSWHAVQADLDGGRAEKALPPGPEGRAKCVAPWVRRARVAQQPSLLERAV